MHVYDWLNDLGGAPALTYDMVEVAFKGGRKGFFRNIRSLDVQTGDAVVVEADRGLDYGTVHMTGELVRLRLKSSGSRDQAAYPNLIRTATLEDIRRWEAVKEREAETFLVARRSIDRMNLPMKLVDTEWQFDKKKVTFFFTAEHRVDFRELVRDLARRFRTRVELRQIGARDEAARIGGIGSCGRELCCSTWLQEFQPVSTQAAKVQNMPLNPVRLSGQCGRLKCCLNYELEQYMDALKVFPKIEARLVTPQGNATVQKIDIFKQMVWVQYEDRTWDAFPLEEAQRMVKADGGRSRKPHAAPDNARRRRGRRGGRRGGRSDGGSP